MKKQWLFILIPVLLCVVMIILGLAINPEVHETENAVNTWYEQNAPVCIHEVTTPTGDKCYVWVCGREPSISCIRPLL